MNLRLTIVLAALSLAPGGLAAGADVPVREHEFNAWPFMVERRSPDTGALVAWQAVGPLLFDEPAQTAGGPAASGMRPFWVETREPARDRSSRSVLYPLYRSLTDEGTFRWSVFDLVRERGPRPGAVQESADFAPRHEFEVFPFWFEREFADSRLNYRAWWPVSGTLRDKLWLERASWTLFPFRAETERRGAITTYSPWPFVQVTSGAAQGWGFWPFYSTLQRPGATREHHALWPFFHRQTREPSPEDPAGTPPREELAVLPFYTRTTGPGLASENYLWPLFGYTDQTAPRRYQERRYLWPFLVQGRGDDRYVNRWAPFYTHSIIQGREKRWYAWPLVRHRQWVDEGVERSRSQLLYFLYWREEQRAAGRPQSPTAELTHLWPILSHWDNGAGRRQWQLLSPLEVFLPANPDIRRTWSPLFSLARHDQRAPGHSRTSLLWDAVTWERHEAEQRLEFHLGPLLGVARAGAATRVSLGNGLLGWQRAAAGGWRMFWLDFPPRRPDRGNQ